MNRRRIASLRKQNLALRARSLISLLQSSSRRNLGGPQTTRLLRRLRHNPLPTRVPLGRRRNQRLICPRGNQRRDLVDAQLRSLLQTPLESIELHQRDKKMQMQRRLPRLNRLQQRKFHAIVATLRQSHTFDARQPHPFPIAQFVELAWLRTQLQMKKCAAAVKITAAAKMLASATQKYPSPYRRTWNSVPPPCSPLSAS